MNISDYLQFGNTLKGVYNANQQSLINQQNQQRINDLLANDALKRRLLNSQVTGGGEGLSALGAIGQSASPPQPVQQPTPSVGLAQTPPAPAPGQSSQPSPVATPSPVPMPGAGITTTPLPPQQPQAPAPFNPNQIDPQTQTLRDKYALRLMQQELTTQQQALQSATSPAQVHQARANIDALTREMSTLMHRVVHESLSGSGLASPTTSASSLTQPSTPPASGAPPNTSTALDKGVIGKSLALAQSNMPVSLLQSFVQKFKALYPNATSEQLYFAAQEVNPTLVQQAGSATKLAGMTIDSLFKGLTTAADMQRAAATQTNAQTRQAALPSQIQANEARAGEAQTIARLYGQGVGGGMPSGPSGIPTQPGSPQPTHDLALSYLNGSLGSTGGPVGAARQNQAFQQLNAIGLTPAAEKPYQNDLMAARSAQTQLQQRAATLQATSQALDTQLDQAIADAKQLNLNGPVFWNGAKLTVGGKAIPTSSPIYQTFMHYDALVADASREAGAQQMFGKATVAGLKNGAQIVSANKGVGLMGVLQGLRDGATASVAALNHTGAAVQLLPTLRLISKSSKPPVAAQAFGFTPMSMQQLKAYAKQYKITDDQAAMALATLPTQPRYVIGYPYGQ